jgi:hypothetical protein
MPASYRIANVIETNAAYYTDFFGDKMCDLVIDPTKLYHEHLTESVDLNHSATMAPKNFLIRLP